MFILVLNGANGSRVLPNSISAPEPLAHQWLELTPLPQKSAANRLGNAPAGSPSFGVASAPQLGNDSSHGSDMVTPTPRRNFRRETLNCLEGLFIGTV